MDGTKYSRPYREVERLAAVVLDKQTNQFSFVRKSVFDGVKVRVSEVQNKTHEDQVRERLSGIGVVVQSVSAIRIREMAGPVVVKFLFVVAKHANGARPFLVPRPDLVPESGSDAEKARLMVMSLPRDGGVIDQRKHR